MFLELGVLFVRVVISKNGIVSWYKSKIIKQPVKSLKLTLSAGISIFQMESRIQI